MALADWLRCPACGSPRVSVVEVLHPEILVECSRCGRRAAVEIREFSAG